MDSQIPKTSSEREENRTLALALTLTLRLPQSFTAWPQRPLALPVLFRNCSPQDDEGGKGEAPCGKVHLCGLWRLLTKAHRF